VYITFSKDLPELTSGGRSTDSRLALPAFSTMDGRNRNVHHQSATTSKTPSRTPSPTRMLSTHNINCLRPLTPLQPLLSSRPAAAACCVLWLPPSTLAPAKLLPCMSPTQRRNQASGFALRHHGVKMLVGGTLPGCATGTADSQSVDPAPPCLLAPASAVLSLQSSSTGAPTDVRRRLQLPRTASSSPTAASPSCRTPSSRRWCTLGHGSRRHQLSSTVA